MARINTTETHKPRYLGQTKTVAVKEFDLIPWKGRPVDITLHCSEFTSHCPVTGQPDFATFEILYCPNETIVETKSMKLYLWQFRDRAEFNEKLVNFIGEDFYNQVKPRYVSIRGKFAMRGGISVECRYEKHADGRV